MITFDKNICTDFDDATRREWLETNGIGGFASGTISGTNTRRYHALLTAATRPPLGRISMLAKFEETVLIDGEGFELSSNRFPGTIHPEGYRFIESFRLDPFPIWTYNVNGVSLEKRIFMIHGRNAVVCTWKIMGSAGDSLRDVSLELRPLLSFVDYHSLQHQNSGFDGDFDSSDGVISVNPVADMPTLYFKHNAASIEETGFWYRNFEYSVEEERGFDHSEDLFQPFLLNFDLKEMVEVVASADEAVIGNVADLEELERKRRQDLLARSGAKTELCMDLVSAADQFIVKRGNGHTVIAGYPWFSDWGRDTMIALNGLTLATGRHEIARDIIVEFSKHVSEGMLPNRFPDAGEEAEYNTVDATLWYFEAVRAYIEASGDLKLLKDGLYAKLKDIIEWHLRGTRYNIHVDTDGMLYAGEEGVQLTWMDAKVGDLVITPRTGKPVEIQALWYNALRIMSDLAAKCGHRSDIRRFDDLAELCRQSFNSAFWNEAEQCLFDVVENDSRDGSVRPNQIFAVSLPYSMVDSDRSRKIVCKVEAELLTPVGLRSLSPKDPRYCPAYIGGPVERDSAYHQGTVWAWLIGGFVDAYRRVYPEHTERTEEIIAGFQDHLSDAGLGQISEIFDAEPPYAPRGCYAQAWSVAELLRVATKTSS